MAKQGERDPEGVEVPAPDPYRELFERSADAILIIEGDKFIDCNEATVRMLRYRDKAELLKTHPSELSPPTQPDGRDSYEKANEMIAIAFERGNHRFEWDHLRADGEVFPVEVLLTAVQEHGRRVLHVVWRDITERKRLEADLRQAQKMEAIGKLAGGIAHDFNNLLVAIVGNSDLLKDELRGQPDLVQLVDEIQKAGERGADLVRQLLTFSRKEEVIKRVIDVNDLVHGIQGLVMRLIGEDIRLVTDLDRQPLPVLAGGGHIEQVVLNLASNARDAMPEGGTLSIRTRLEEVEEPLPGEDEPRPPGTYALLTFSDTGKGMKPQDAERAFDPFFTTKSLGKGTGLGLATVYGIVQQNDGSIALESELGKGTTVRIHLPVSDAAVTEPAQSAEVLAVAGDETILVAEDESAVSALIVNALRQKGYTVIAARDGMVAHAEYAKHAQEIDLVVTDVIMPLLGGPEFIIRLRQAGHRPKVLFISGYTDDALGRLRRMEGEVDLLEKPFRTEELLRRVRQALDRSATGRESKSKMP